MRVSVSGGGHALGRRDGDVRVGVLRRRGRAIRGAGAGVVWRGSGRSRLPSLQTGLLGRRGGGEGEHTTDNDLFLA